MTRSWNFALMVLAAALFAFLLLPVAAIALGTSPSEFLAGLGHPLVRPALILSALTSATSVVIIVLLGTPLAWLLARSERRAARWVETFVQLPIVVPPAVAGLGLLLAFGRRGLIGESLDAIGIRFAFTTAAVIMAEVFVGAPFYVRAAATAFRGVDRELLGVARTLGASPPRVFFIVALPLALPGLVAGAALAWARGLGEFGATLMFAGNVTGRTQTLPLAIYEAFESDIRGAQALALILVAFAFTLLTFLHMRLPVTRDVQ